MTRCPVRGCGEAMHVLFGCRVHGEAEPDEEARAALMAEADADDEVAEPHEAWSEEEIAFLMDNLGELTGPEMAEALGRTHSAVKHWFERERISNPRKHRPRTRRIVEGIVGALRGKPWTEEEKWALEAGELRVLFMSRSFHAVEIKASREGAPLRAGDGMMSLNQVARHYGVGPQRVWDWLHRGLLPAKRSGRMWRIDPAKAERIVPALKKASRAHHGVKGWWNR